MFGIKKTKKAEQQLLTNLNDLIEDGSISPQERQILQVAKAGLEKNEYLPRVLRDLEDGLQPLALQGKMSDKVRELYLAMVSQSGSELKWRGLCFGNLM
ncbi:MULTISPECIES: bacteriocin immunity protein [Lactobacillus]|uniref:Bacteriocin immunity protein n=1 Tax=Lactobacillus xujianguonis TaxID=2495899 RepID=A0A437SWY8_9LACO|nr:MULTISPECIES: bacteriocin immunity protein [Lactobacillus]RVU71431.1 bacteriocin immunity protein [Lactobacillus xujianguonis]RVU72395.1 bacteriocin immunity protein [Lactobacillus xujianguonis]